MPRLPPAPMISTVSPFFSSATLNRRFQAVGHVAHHHRGVAEIEAGRHVDRGAGGDADELGKAALPLDAHHAFRAVVAGAVLRADVERHAAGGRDPFADLAAGDAGADRVDDAGAVDAGNERQHRAAEHLLAGAQAHVEHAVDGRGMDADAHLALPGHRVRPVLVFEVFGRAELVDHVGFQLPDLPLAPRGYAPAIPPLGLPSHARPAKMPRAPDRLSWIGSPLMCGASPTTKTQGRHP